MKQPPKKQRPAQGGGKKTVQPGTWKKILACLKPYRFFVLLSVLLSAVTVAHMFSRTVPSSGVPV